eukprot:CAMPEP_0115304444 /NCGR_PEP_ID=MMETSP0270-20121206/71468_1 /TAXON_ID=71861 /ORGANISM="Scrippsiella trochoidea, Strain CCMP3099" /LENGTH=96 /DNA_ID=CAMNT_0002722535 /DNA_START=419 /DNA_END=706 /DNA_ORIENTATION=-
MQWWTDRSYYGDPLGVRGRRCACTSAGPGDPRLAAHHSPLRCRAPPSRQGGATADIHRYGGRRLYAAAVPAGLRGRTPLARASMHPRRCILLRFMG